MLLVLHVVLYFVLYFGLCVIGILRWVNPKVRPEQTIFTVLGRTLTLDCSVKGEPSITVTWLWNDSPILPDDERLDWGKNQEVTRVIFISFGEKLSSPCQSIPGVVVALVLIWLLCLFDLAPGHDNSEK